jgi:hypothetical protein
MEFSEEIPSRATLVKENPSRAAIHGRSAAESGFEDLDHRSSLFVGLTAENLARHVASLERTSATPSKVGSLLAEARRTSLGGSTLLRQIRVERLQSAAGH